MAAVAKVTVDTSGLKRIAGELDPRARKVIAKAAMDVEDRARRAAPVDTGALRASIYTSGGAIASDYVAARAIAKGLNPGATFDDEEKGEGGLNAVIGASVEYAIHQEFGTKKMGAQPFLIPALEAIRRSFLGAWGELTK